MVVAPSRWLSRDFEQSAFEATYFRGIIFRPTDIDDDRDGDDLVAVLVVRLQMHVTPKRTLFQYRLHGHAQVVAATRRNLLDVDRDLLVACARFYHLE